MNIPLKPARIFLSYVRKDVAKVTQLHQQLVEAGFQPWMDTEDLIPGEEWEPAINKAIRKADFFLACMSPNSVNKRGVIQPPYAAAKFA